MRINCNIALNSRDSQISCESQTHCLSAATTDNVQSASVFQNDIINFENQKHDENNCADLPSRQSDNALSVDESSEKRYYQQITRMWRNWQTRRLQEPVGSTPWRFDSSHPQFPEQSLPGFSSNGNLIKGPLQADKYLD